MPHGAILTWCARGAHWISVRFSTWFVGMAVDHVPSVMRGNEVLDA